MTAEEVRNRIDEIAKMDDECAHSAADSLYREVLRAIELHTAEPNAAELASAALEVEDLDFERWCA